MPVYQHHNESVHIDIHNSIYFSCTEHQVSQYSSKSLYQYHPVLSTLVFYFSSGSVVLQSNSPAVESSPIA